MMMGNYGGFSVSGSAWTLGILALLLLLAGGLLLIAWARREALPSRHKNRVSNSYQVAADVLKDRYATGKITLAEYEQTLNVLGERALIARDADSNAELDAVRDQSRMA